MHPLVHVLLVSLLPACAVDALPAAAPLVEGPASCADALEVLRGALDGCGTDASCVSDAMEDEIASLPEDARGAFARLAGCVHLACPEESRFGRAGC